MGVDSKLRTASGFPGVVKECWAIHQALRQLGFPAGEIYVLMAKDVTRPSDESALFVTLRTQGKEFNISLDSYKSEKEAEDVMGQWTEFATIFNSDGFDERELREIYESSSIYQNKVMLLMALRKKNIFFGVN